MRAQYRVVVYALRMNPKKPPGRAQGHRRHDLEVVRVDAPGVSATLVPPPPDGLLASVREGWEAFWTTGAARLVTAADMPALRRLFLMRDEHERMRRAYRKQPLVAGSTGNTVLSPLGRRMAILGSEAIGLAAPA